jgi:hypothetical protein
MDRTLQGLRRRLEKAELEHLRQHCAELRARLDIAEERAANAEATADCYWHQHMDLIQSLNERDDVQIGITQDGHIGVIKEAA